MRCLYGFMCTLDIDTQRPSNERIANLVEENQRLREEAQILRSHIQNQRETSKERGPDAHPNKGCPSPFEPSSHRTTHGASPIVATAAARRLPSVAEVPGSLHNITERSYVTFGAQSQDHASRYHGPTSAMFDDADLDSSMEQGTNADPKVTMARARSSLVATATKQRTLHSPQSNIGKSVI